MSQNNSQLVVSITNKATFEQAWYNAVRTRKPQTFKADVTALVDPTDGGQRCDFCSWQNLTAEDTWGRFERSHAVTGSNLFKYGEPAHGLVLFKHHHPLAFSYEQLSDFLAVSADWFDAASKAHPGARHPFFIWNCGPRAGASQFHGHGQLMLTTVAVPAQSLLTHQAAQHAALHPGSSYYADLIRAHAAVGLARAVGEGDDRCWILAHLAPQKDMEVLILSSPPPLSAAISPSPSAPNGGDGAGSGSGLRSRVFVSALHAALRALVDRLGVQTFNCGILNVQVRGGQEAPTRPGGAGAGGAYGASVEERGADVPWSGLPACTPLHRDLDGGGDAEECGAGLGLPEAAASGLWRPMLARVVSRGKVSSPASDFGCLEVVGHASIGHTDPFVVMRAIDEQLADSGEAELRT